MDEVTYPILMHNIIDDKTKRNDPVVNNIFITPQQSKVFTPPPSKGITASPTVNTPSIDGKKISVITKLKEGYGFIQHEKSELFFFHADIENCEFNELQVGDKVEYKIGKNDKGPTAVEIYKV